MVNYVYTDPATLDIVKFPYVSVPSSDFIVY